MSTTINTLLNAVAASGAGTPVSFAAEPRYQGGSHTIEVSGTFTATVSFQGRIDTLWYDFWTTTGAGAQTVDGAFDAIRGSVPSYTSGNITMKVRYPLLQDLATDISTLLSRLSSARAGYLDELAAANIPADVDTLLARLTAARAAALDVIAVDASVKGIQKQIRRTGGTA